jgi:hypothetical protein
VFVSPEQNLLVHTLCRLVSLDLAIEELGLLDLVASNLNDIANFGYRKEVVFAQAVGIAQEMHHAVKGPEMTARLDMSEAEQAAELEDIEAVDDMTVYIAEQGGCIAVVARGAAELVG